MNFFFVIIEWKILTIIACREKTEITESFGFCPRSMSYSDGIYMQEIPKSKMHLLSQKPLKICELIFFQHFFLTPFRENYFWSQETFKIPDFFWGKLLLLIHLITLRWRRHIYLSLNQIWAQSERDAIASERHLWRLLLVISGPLVVSGWTCTQVREGL